MIISVRLSCSVRRPLLRFVHLALMDKVNAAVLTVDGGNVATALRVHARATSHAQLRHAPVDRNMRCHSARRRAAMKPS